MTREQIADFIEGIGGAQAAADYILSWGRSANYERNRKYREVHVYGKAVFNEDSFNADDAPLPRERTSRFAPARRLGMNEWNAILSLAPHNLKDRDVLVASARHGQGETAAIAAAIGVCQRQVRNIQNKILGWAQTNLTQDQIAAHLNDPITQGIVTRRVPSKAGRKPRGWVVQMAAVYDLLGDPSTPRKPRKMRKAGAVRVRRARQACPGQLMLFEEAA
jgi:hypothetical protein